MSPSSLRSTVLTARLAGQRKPIGAERAAELVDRLWPHAMKLLDLALAQPGTLLEPPVASLRAGLPISFGRSLGKPLSCGSRRSLVFSSVIARTSLVLQPHCCGCYPEGVCRLWFVTANSQRSRSILLGRVSSRYEVRCFGPNDGPQHDKCGCGVRLRRRLASTTPAPRHRSAADR